MTFDFSSEQENLRDRARAFAAERVAPVADEIDRTASVPDDVAQGARQLLADADDTAAVLAIEELAAVSGAIAVTAIADSKGATLHNLAALQAAPAPPDSPRAQLLLAAVALGLGRAARDAGLAEIEEATAHPGKEEKPHWLVADAATELEAARMLTFAAAQAINRGEARSEIAVARLAATVAARHAVDLAFRVVGVDGYRQGSVLERVSRDVRAVSLLLGSEEQFREQAADGELHD